MVQCYTTYTKAMEDLELAKEFFAESSGSGGDAEMKEMAREEASGNKKKWCRKREGWERERWYAIAFSFFFFNVWRDPDL